MKKILTIIILFLNIPIFAENFIVTAKSGLILRSEPTKKSKKITTIPYGGFIERISEFKKEDKDLYNELENNVYLSKYHYENVWYQIKYGDQEGYVYSFYLIKDTDENRKYFLYDETRDNIRIKRDFHTYHNPDRTKTHVLMTKVFFNEALSFYLESPIYFNESLFVNLPFIYFERPIEPSEKSYYEGGFIPHFYTRIVKANLNKKNNLQNILVISANDDNNNQIEIEYNNNIKREYLIKLPVGERPSFYFDGKMKKIKNSIYETFACLNKKGYFLEHLFSDKFEYHKLIQFTFQNNFNFVEDHKIKLLICNEEIMINFEENTIY